MPAGDAGAARLTPRPKSRGVQTGWSLRCIGCRKRPPCAAGHAVRGRGDGAVAAPSRRRLLAAGQLEGCQRLQPPYWRKVMGRRCTPSIGKDGAQGAHRRSRDMCDRRRAGRRRVRAPSPLASLDAFRAALARAPRGTRSRRRAPPARANIAAFAGKVTGEKKIQLQPLQPLGGRPPPLRRQQRRRRG